MQDHTSTETFPIAFNFAPVFFGICDASNAFPDTVIIKGAVKSLTQFDWVCAEAKSGAAAFPGLFYVLSIGR